MSLVASEKFRIANPVPWKKKKKKKKREKEKDNNFRLDSCFI